MKKKIINPCNSYMLLKNDDENIDIDEMEEKKNNSEEKPKQIIDNIFVFPSQNSKIENKIIKIPQQSENEIKEKENINKRLNNDLIKKREEEKRERERKEKIEREKEEEKRRISI